MSLMNFRSTMVGLLLIVGTSIYTQTATTQYDFTKGEVLDVLLLQQQPETDELLMDYFKTAFPVAKQYGYRPMTGYKIQKITQGNHMPTSFIFGKWEDLERREAFIEEVKTPIPDFHERRRSIWSYFGLTYYAIEEDLSFQIEAEKFNVVTAYWRKPDTSIDDFHSQWIQQAEENGGELVLSLTGGKSPYGYYHQPEFLTITAWESEEAFTSFLKESQALSHEGVQHINQMVIF